MNPSREIERVQEQQSPVFRISVEDQNFEDTSSGNDVKFLLSQVKPEKSMKTQEKEKNDLKKLNGSPSVSINYRYACGNKSDSASKRKMLTKISSESSTQETSDCIELQVSHKFSITEKDAQKVSQVITEIQEEE